MYRNKKDCAWEECSPEEKVMKKILFKFFLNNCSIEKTCVDFVFKIRKKCKQSLKKYLYMEKFFQKGAQGVLK